MKEDQGQETPRIALGLVRVSTGKQATNGVSLEVQLIKIKQYCALNNLTLVGVYGDPLSGKKGVKRPGLEATLQLARERKISHIVVYKLDRLARHTIETLQIVDKLDEQGVSLHSITEMLDTRSPIGRFVLRTLASLAEMERDLISERTRECAQTMKAEGKRVGGRPSYGFQVIDGELVEETGEQRVICRIAELNGKGYTSREIADTLTTDGVMTRKGTRFTHTQVCRILKAA